MEKSHKYSLRFSLVPGTDTEDRIRGLAQFCKDALIDDVMFFIGAESQNDGHFTQEMTMPYVEVIKKASAALSRQGISTSLNPWATLLHGDRGRTLHKGQNFGLMVGPDGMRAAAVVCPLSREWRAYYIDYLRFLCAELNPKILWLEDDFRLHNHEPLKFGGCFCREHMRLYADRLDAESISRADFVRGMKEGAKGFREAYAYVNGRVMEELLSFITEGLKDFPVKLGLMTSGNAAYRLEGRDQRRMFEIASRYAPTANRVSLANYRETSYQRLCYTFNRDILVNRAALADNVPLYSEIENAPMSRYSKSVSFTKTQILTAQPYLLEGTTLDIFDFEGNGVTDGKSFVAALSEIKPYLNRLAGLSLKYSDAGGITVLTGKNPHLYKRGCKSVEDILPRVNWLGGLLSCFGAAVRYIRDADISGTVAALPAEAAAELSDEEILLLFERNTVIINADTLELLCRRGLNQVTHAKVKRRMRERTAAFSYEQAGQDRFDALKAERATAQVFMGDTAEVSYGKEIKTETLTYLYNHKGEMAAPGITLVNGRILVLPYYEDEENYDSGMPYGLLQPLRRNAIRHAIGLADFNRGALFADGCMLVPHCYKSEGVLYVMLSNFSADRVSEISLYLNGEFKTTEVMSPESPFWEKVGFNRKEGRCVLKTAVEAGSVCTLKFISDEALV